MAANDAEFNGKTFNDLPASIKGAFLDTKAELVTLPQGFGLFKLSRGDVTAHPKFGTLSPWWSPLQPYREDDLGALGRFEEARLNKVSMREMVRFASAVSVDWNSLDNYLEIVLTAPMKAWWGQYTPQPDFQDKTSIKGKIAFFEHEAKRIYTPDTLGGIEAWQFFIPGMKEAHVRKTPAIPAHDMAALALRFGAQM